MLANPPTWRILLLPRPLNRGGAGDGEDSRKLKGGVRRASVHGVLGGAFLIPQPKWLLLPVLIRRVEVLGAYSV